MSLQLDQLCQQFREQWGSGRPVLAEYLSSLSDDERREVAPRLIEIDVSERLRAGETPLPEDYQEVLSEDELSRLSDVFGDPTVSTGTNAATRTWAEGLREAPETPRTKIGRYQVIEILGQGAFGTVYRAQDELLSRDVAIKVPRIIDTQERLVAGLLLEAESAAKLSHPNIVRVYDFGHLDDGGCFVVFEYIEGKHLASAMRSGPLSVDRAIELMIAIAEGVHHAHLKGLFHRDLKPTNIMLTSDGRPMVTDFGLAIRDEDQLAARGEVSGTYAYMSPEQARGDSHLLDGRSDTWSLGVILYEMLTGRRPFVGATRDDIFEQIQHRDPRPLRQIDDSLDPRLEEICFKCLARHPSERYPTALDLAEMLRTVVSESVPRRITEGNRSQDEKSGKRSFALPITIGICLVTAIVSASFAFHIIYSSRETPPVPEGEPGHISPVQRPLRTKPTTFAWSQVDGEAPEPMHDPESEKYVFLDPSERMFATTNATLNSQSFDIESILELGEWKGEIGVLWGLESPETTQQLSQTCLGIVFLHYAFGPSLQLREYTFERVSSSNWKHVDMLVLDRIPLSAVPPRREAKMRVSVDRETIVVVFDDEEWKPVVPDWFEGVRGSRPGKTGITGKASFAGFRELQISSLVVSPIEKDQ